MQDISKTGGFWHRAASVLATPVLFALVSGGSFSLAYLLSMAVSETQDTALLGAMWAMISAIIVTQDTRAATLSNAWIRVLGSFIGAMFAAFYLMFFPFSIVGMTILIAIVVLVCELLHMPGHLRLAALTAGIVIVISALNPGISPTVNAALRFFEVLIGSSIAVAAAGVWHYAFGSN